MALRPLLSNQLFRDPSPSAILSEAKEVVDTKTIASVRVTGARQRLARATWCPYERDRLLTTPQGSKWVHHDVTLAIGHHRIQHVDALEAAVLQNGGFLLSNGAKQPELGQGGHSVIKTDLLDDLALLQLEDGHAREVHLPACVGRQAAGEESLKAVPPPSHWPTTTLPSATRSAVPRN
jgi:hypothetical protein